VILSALCDWLVGQRYLDSNPFAGLAPEHYPKRNSAIEKVLSPALWEKVIDYAEKQSSHPEYSDAAHKYYQRVLFILRFAYRTGLRLDELVKAKTGDLKVIASPEGDQYWLDVIGKGQKHREVPIPPSLIDAINRQLYARNLASIDHTSGHHYLIGKIRGDMSEGVSASALARTLKSFFVEAAQALGENDPAVANRLKKASTHWLRHSHGSHAVARGVPLAIVRDNLGHSDLSTTSIYIHTERDDRYKAMAETT
jgi:integrase